MNAELLYTSAPQGLKQGSRGFCTVLSTVGMPLNIATKLESLSGYRHLHPSGTPDAAKNPVNHSHMKLTVGGRTLSVISRISDYGLDYSQRTNKLAHHVVVDSPMPTCGPAALLGDPSVIRSEWDGNCVNIPTPPTFPALSVEPDVCQAWESIAGDAGWAGVVANAWLNNASKPIFLIFSEDQSPEILPLIAEAIAILPPSKRWQATFGTYVTNLPPDVDCKVRCVVAGSDEARMASARGVVIDLTQPCGPAPSSEAATAARNGTFVGARSNVPPSHGSMEVDEEQPPAIGDTIEDSEPTDFDPERPFGTQSAGPPPTIRPGTGRIAPTLKQKDNNRTNKNKLLFVVTAVLASFIAIVVLGFVSFKNNLSQLVTVSQSLATTPGPDRVEQTISNEKRDQYENEGGKSSEKTIGLQQKADDAVESSDADKKTGEMPSQPPPDESKKLDPTPTVRLDQKKILVNLSSFYLTYGSDQQKRIPLTAGIPNSLIDATASYQSEDPKEQEIFLELTKDTNRIEWAWEELYESGANWSVLKNQKTSSFIVGSENKPKTKFRAILKIKNEGAFVQKDEWISGVSENSEQTIDYIKLRVIARQLLSSPDDNDVVADLPDFLPVEYKLSFLGSRKSKSASDEKSNRITFSNLRTIFKQSEEEDVFDQWDLSVKHLDAVNKLRDELKDRFIRSSKLFKTACDKYENLPGNIKLSMSIFLLGLQDLLRTNLGEEYKIDYFSSWFPGPLVAWAEKHKSPEIIKDFSKVEKTRIQDVQIDNEANGILLKYWVGDNGMVDGNSREKNWFSLVDDLVESHKQFLLIKNQIIDKDKFFHSPNGCFAIFRNSEKTEGSDGGVEQDSLARKNTFVCDLSLWIQVKFDSTVTLSNDTSGSPAEPPKLPSTSTADMRLPE